MTTDANRDAEQTLRQLFWDGRLSTPRADMASSAGRLEAARLVLGWLRAAGIEVTATPTGEMEPIELMQAWQAMDETTQRVTVALPSQMTEACRDLEAARLRMRSAIQQFAMSVVKGAAQ